MENVTVTKMSHLYAVMCSSVMCISINFESNLHIKQPQQTLQAARITWRMYRSPLRFKLLAHLLRRECKNGLKICLRHGISPSKASLFSTLKLRSHLHVQSCQLSSNSQIGEIVVVRDAISNYINVFNDSMFKKKIACTASDIDRELIAKFFPFVARYEAQNASHAVTAIETINMLRLAPDEAFLYYVSGACGCLGEPVQVQSALLLMDIRGYPRTTTTMTTLLEAYASIGDREGVDVTFSAMKALNLNTHVDSISLLLSKYNMNNMEPPNEDFAYYQRSVRNFSLKGDIAMTENVIADMRAYGVSPTIDTMNLLLNAYLKNRDAIGAQRTFDEIKEAGLVPNLASFNKLIGAYSSTGDVFSAEGVVQAAVEAGYEPGIHHAM